MYEELIRSCRACATGYVGNCDNCMFSGEDCYKQLHKASADAIEAQDRHILTLQHEVNRLNKQVEELLKNVAYWQAQLTKSMCGETLAELDKPRWIPVTERLPEDLARVIVFCNDGVFFGFCEHLIVDDEEVVEWNDFLYYPITPTHWMPLPSTEGLNET